MKNSKRPIQSKTIWFNCTFAVLSVLAEQSDLVRATLPPRAYLALMIVIAVANAALRLTTSQPIKIERPNKKAGGNGL